MRNKELYFIRFQRAEFMRSPVSFDNADESVQHVEVIEMNLDGSEQERAL